MSEGPPEGAAHLEAAERLARSIENSGGRRRGWREVRELLELFELNRLSPDARRAMSTAFEQVGLSVEPPLEKVNRRDTVALSLQNGEVARQRPNGGARRAVLDREVEVREWKDGRGLRRPALSELRGGPEAGSVRWFDIRDAMNVGPDELHSTLNPLCGGQLTIGMVADVLSPDPRPKVKRYGDGEEMRLVSAFRVTAEESDKGAEESASKAGVLVFLPVEFLVGPNWLVTSWQDTDIYRGANRVDEGRPAPPARLYQEVERCWSSGKFKTSGDLATLILYELTLSYAAARRKLYVWLEEWELDFYRRPEHEERLTLFEVRAAAAIFRDWLNPLNRSGLREDVTKAWFPNITGDASQGGRAQAMKADTYIDRSLDALRNFGDTVRASFDLVQAREQARQTRVAEVQRERAEAFERTLTKWATILLVPTFVTSFYGANEKLPLQESGYWGTGVMVVAMIVMTAAALLVVDRLQKRQHEHVHARRERHHTD